MRYRYVIMVLLFVGMVSMLSGCVIEEPTDTDDNSNDIVDEETDIVLVDYSVVTQGLTTDKRYETIADGFLYSENANRYLVRGEVLNNGTENISKAYVYMNFYDSEDNLLHQIYDIIFDFKVGDVEDFTGDFTIYDSDDFAKADHIEFTFYQE